MSKFRPDDCTDAKGDVPAHVQPPIPIRDFDWQAVTDDYDADCDQDGFFSNHPIGAGPSEDAAIKDLLEQLEDQT